MKKKVFIKEGFSFKGERYTRNTIGSIEASAFEKLKREGYVEDVGVALGVECKGDSTDLSGYVKVTEYNKLKNQVTELSSTISTLQSQLQALSEKVGEIEQSPVTVSEVEEKPKLTKGKRA